MPERTRRTLMEYAKLDIEMTMALYHEFHRVERELYELNPKNRRRWKRRKRDPRFNNRILGGHK